ncbi:MAG: flagellar assembly protein FliH [Betaproteobacteria bacterium]|nr:flagellar assembly protein FliH [Betaproteobacteria bacterium]
MSADDKLPSVRRWQPHDFGARRPPRPAAPDNHPGRDGRPAARQQPPSETAQAMPKQASPHAEAMAAPPPAPAPPDIQAIFRLPTAEDIEQLHQQSHKEGFEAGYEEGTARARLDAMRLHGLVENLEAALVQVDQQVAEEMLALALEVARLVVRDTLAVRPEAVLAVVREALQELPQRSAVICLHPEDGALVRQALHDLLEHGSHRIIEDGSVERGSCRIDCESGTVDATLATRWQRVMDAMGARAAWSGDTAP